jgi:hypothetical protein
MDLCHILQIPQIPYSLIYHQIDGPFQSTHPLFEIVELRLALLGQSCCSKGLGKGQGSRDGAGQEFVKLNEIRHHPTDFI